MSLEFFFIGGLIFAAYMYFTIWNIFNGAKKNREENYPDYYDRHGQMREPTADDMDMDGMGNFSRFPEDTGIKIKRRSVISRKKEEML